MKVVSGRKIILFGKTLTRGEKKEQEKEKRLEKEIFVTYVGMEVGNVGNWIFSIRLSIFKKRGKGKLDLVKLRGAGRSTAGKRVPNKIEQYSYGVDRIVAEGNPFCFKGTVGGKLCFF